MEKRIILITAGALLALTPAAAGAIGNSSLGHRIPVSGPVPTAVQVGDDNGGDVDRNLRTEPGDDRRVQGGPSASSSPSPGPWRSHDAKDGHGGDRGRDDRAEPGDDRSGRGSDDSGKGSSGHGPSTTGWGSTWSGCWPSRPRGTSDSGCCATSPPRRAPSSP